MRIGMIGDTHFTNKTPARRLDDIWETQKRKMIEALNIFRDRRCDYVLQAGDMFDNPMVSYSVIAEIIGIMKEYVYWTGQKVGVVFGQHDIFGHSAATLPNSPLSILESAGVIDVLGPDGLKINREGKDTVVYGVGFGETIPSPKSIDGYNVLVAHIMMGDRPLFPDQELESPVSFLTQNPAFNLILVGDYHYRFVSREGSRTIINCGALVRKSISQFDLEHEPAVAVIDTISNELEVVKLDIEPVDKVFDMTPVQKRDDSKLTRFIEDLRRQQYGDKTAAGWRQKLVEVMDKMRANPEIRRIIDTALENVNK